MPDPSLQDAEVVGELKVALERAAELLEKLAAWGGSRAVGGSETAGEMDRLKRRLEAAEEDLAELSDRLVETENQRGRLMNLYVATYQLHATLDLSEVTSTIAEITRELVGAEKFALLLRVEDEGDLVCEVSMASDDDVKTVLIGSNGRYRGGDPAIDEALADGQVRMETTSDSPTLAVVPLTVQGAVVGVLVLLKLLDHKPCLTSDDRDLLDLIAAHAASALLAARVYSATDRRLKTLENLVKLVR